MKKCNRCFLSLVLVVCLVLSMFSGVVAAPSATLIVTTPSGYTSAAAVNYKTVNGYLTNWGARGEDCGFLTTYAQGFYTGSYQYSTLSKVSGGTSTSNAPSSSLYSSLQTLMVSNHTFFTKYGSTSSSDCKNIYQYTDCMLGDPTYVSTLYRGLKVGGPWDSGVSYNQEHIWPQSKCLGTASTSDIGDIMHLRPANPSENSSRGNTAYGESSSYYDPGVSVRGDCARTLLYMYVRWGNTGNMWGTDGVIESLDVLLRWIKEDPVDTWEMGHNDAVQSITGTRNVFVDYPEYAYLLFGRSVPSDLTTPSNGGNPGGSTGGSTGGSVATLVTNASTLKAGDQIIIAALDYDVAMSTTQNTNNRAQATVTKSGSTLTFGSDAQVLTLVAGSTADTFALDTGSGYLTAASSTANNLKTKSLIDANSSWTLGVDANTGAAFITANGTYTRNLVRYNYSSDLFSCYAANNTQKDVAIYRLGGSSGGSGDSGDSGSTATGAAIRVTTGSSLKAGDQIIIAAMDYDAALGTTQNSSNRSQGSVTKSGSTLLFGSDVQVLTLESGTVSGTFALQAGSGKYLYAPSSASNQLKTTSSVVDNGSWSITIDSSTGIASVVAAGTSTRNVLRYNASSGLFSCYAANNTQKDLAIYRIAQSGQCNHSYSSRISTYATCTKAGVRTYTCVLCGDSYTESIAAKGHSYTSSVTSATCTEQGYTTYSCSACGDSYTGSYTSATGHSYTSKVTTAATCTGSGVKTYTCSRCYHSYTEAIAATGHSYTSKVTAATCTAQGYTTYTCSKCGDSYTGNYTNPKGHSYSGNYCTVCGAVNPNCTHSYTSKVTTAATCTAAGVKTFTCGLCGNSYTQAIPATGHSFSGGSCTTCGAADPSVSVDYTYYLVGYINGMDYGCEADYENNGIYKFVNGKLTATFTTDSYVFVKTEGNSKWLLSEAYCTDTTCTFYEGGSEKMFVPGNVSVTFTLTKNADGSVTVSYTTGGTTACSHTYVSSVTSAATCTKNGIKTFTCTKCSSAYTQAIPATGHSYVNGSCTACGAADPTVGGQTYYLVGYINGMDYGCEADYENMGIYKFADGKLTATFTTDSYVFVKTEGNGRWLLSDAYCTDTSCTFKEGGSEKMYVPGNVAVTFTLKENGDGSVTISYTTGAATASVVPTLTLKAPTLEFKDTVTVNALYTAENTQDVEEMGMVTYSARAANVSVDTAEHVIPGATYDATTNRYVSSSQGIYAKHLGDTVYLAIYARLKDGTYAYSKQASYSAVQYATNQLKNSTDVALKQLVAAMLNYGAEAQLYFGHNTGSLANSSLTAAQKALPAAYNSSMISSVPAASASKQGIFANNSGFSKRVPAISFEGAFCINYFFTPNYAPTSGITLYYWNAADYNAASTLTTANATGSLRLTGSGIGEYRGDIVGIAAKSLSDAVYVAAVYQSGGITWTSGALGYSIGSYCGSQSSKGGDISGLAEATAVYGYHARQYFG